MLVTTKNVLRRTRTTSRGFARSSGSVVGRDIKVLDEIVPDRSTYPAAAFAKERHQRGSPHQHRLAMSIPFRRSGAYSESGDVDVLNVDTRTEISLPAWGVLPQSTP